MTYPNKLFAKWLVCGLLLTTALGCGSSSHHVAAGEPDASVSDEDSGPYGHSQADTYTPGMRKLGRDGLFAVRLTSALPAPPELGANKWTVVVESADGKALADAEITQVQPWMLEHNHGTGVQPVIAAGKKAGEFSIDRIDLRMPKLWEVRITVTSDGKSDLVVYRFWVDE